MTPVQIETLQDLMTRSGAADYLAVYGAFGPAAAEAACRLSIGSFAHGAAPGEVEWRPGPRSVLLAVANRRVCLLREEERLRKSSTGVLVRIGPRAFAELTDDELNSALADA